MSLNDSDMKVVSEPGRVEPRIGVYICHCGGNISDVVDVERVADVISHLPDVVVSKHYMFMCSDPGQGMIEDDIRKENLNRVVVAACSPSLHEITFRNAVSRAGLNPYLYENVNIREQVSWVSKSDKDGATEKAIRLVAAAVAKARLLEPLDPPRVKANGHVVVVGAGISGMRTARDLARKGFTVSLLEESPFLGGRVSQLSKVFPTGERAREILDALVGEVTSESGISIYTRAEVIDVSGFVGNYKVKVRLHPRGVRKAFDMDLERAVMDSCPEETDSEYDYNLVKRKAIYRTYSGAFPDMLAIDWSVCTRCGRCVELAGEDGIDLNEKPRDVDITAGAIVLATGFDHYTPRPGEYGFGKFKEVLTLPQVIRMLDEDGPTGGELRLEGKEIKNIVFIHCVGSRQIEGVNEPGTDGRINNYCSRVCCTAALQTAIEIKEKYPEVKIFDLFQDIRTYGRGHEEYYLDASRMGVTFFRYEGAVPPVVEEAPQDSDSPLIVRVKDVLTFGEELEVPADMIVLATGMVPHRIDRLVDILKLPRSADGFLQEVHPKLRPVELAITGIMIAGTCQAPMDITESAAASAAAAAKSSSLLGTGEITLDPFVAHVDYSLCEGSGRCVEECLYTGAVELVEMELEGRVVRRAKVNAAICTGCGACVAVCPTRAIQVAGWSIQQYEAMIDAISRDEL